MSKPNPDHRWWETKIPSIKKTWTVDWDGYLAKWVSRLWTKIKERLGKNK